MNADAGRPERALKERRGEWAAADVAMTHHEDRPRRARAQRPAGRASPPRMQQSGGCRQELSHRSHPYTTSGPRCGCSLKCRSCGLSATSQRDATPTRGDLPERRNVDGAVTRDHAARDVRSEEHTSELQSLAYLVCRLLLEKKKKEIETAA